MDIYAIWFREDSNINILVREKRGKGTLRRLNTTVSAMPSHFSPYI